MKTAYPITSNPVTITLYANIPFDNTYKNHTIISDLFRYNATRLYTGTTANTGVPKERFLNRKQALAPQGNYFYYTRWTFTDTFNFHYSNGLICSVVMELTPAQTNANYMKVVSGTDTYYYFITAINQLNEDTYTLSLECDVLMTYQDEFLTSMQGTGSSNRTPVFTTRKHCHRYTADGLVPYCADFKTGDDAFSGVKPSYVKSVTKAGFTANHSMDKLEGIMWLYVCVSAPYDAITGYTTNKILYKHQKNNFPFVMMALPLNVSKLTYQKNVSGTLTYTITTNQSDLQKAVFHLIDDGSVHGAKISPYPPFTNESPDYALITRNNTSSGIELTIASPNVDELVTNQLFQMNVGNNKLIYGEYLVSEADPTILKLLSFGFAIVNEQNDITYNHKTLHNDEFVNTTAPTILSNRYNDPKLLFEPFRKYTLSAQYSSQGWELFPELMFSKYALLSTSTLFSFTTITSGYIGDNNFYTYLNNSYLYGYNYEKIGLASSVNYIFPCGTNALDVFNSTQSQTFYNSKIASGITSALTISGGLASTGLGIAGAVGSMGMSAPASAGMITAGVTAISQGTASLVMNEKSITAKMEDLKNTPDSINISGSNYITDTGIATATYGMPYLIIYETSEVIKENANDYFYSYGYQVARDCYFNLQLKVDMSGNNFIDNNLFGRTIFNYVQINEDITNKINADIPLIAKQKLSSIFNNGITLWSFFGFSPLWSDDDTQPTGIPMPDRWFLKHTYDNTEYNG